MEKTAICNLAAVPMRFEPSDKSEMVNQVIFGETMDILDQNEKWYLCRLHHDQYTGWIDKKQVAITAPPPQNRQVLSSAPLLLTEGNDLPRIVPAGAYLYGNSAEKESGKTITPSESSIAAAAQIFFGTPYLWGGRTALGMDCSGFTQIVFRMCGIDIPRNASQQVEYGTLVPFVQESQTGDLAFFDNTEGRVIHVGIIIKDEKTSSFSIIHCSGKVRIDVLDHNGIFHSGLRFYSHNLRTIRRFFSK
ncbi:MAG: C40 family peptidase [Crocinitomicaceae bacterium]|nr:C40 family peptidase [Crocinitomicaceae bacterium]